MTNRSEYLRAKAAEALQLAERANPMDREAWRNLASGWLSMLPAQLRDRADVMPNSAEPTARS